MNKGFGSIDSNNGKVTVVVNDEEIEKLLKKYKKIKKYKRSPLFEVKTMDGTETYVSKLIQEAQENL
jgi:hypothetical protein